MLGLSLALAAVAAVVHVYIFVLESVLWTAPRGRATFGTSPEEAAATKEMAFNQGFYNLFLAIVTAVGIVLLATGEDSAGAALVFAGAGSMVLAGVVLLVSSPSKARSALVQLSAPALAVVALLVAVVR